MEGYLLVILMKFVRYMKFTWYTVTKQY